MGAKAFCAVSILVVLGGCSVTEQAEPEPVRVWIDGNGWFGCRLPSEYNNIYTRLVGGDRQGAARRIADADTSGRLTKYQSAEEVLLLREKDDLVMLRRPGHEQVFWTRKEAVTRRAPDRPPSDRTQPDLVAESKPATGPNESVLAEMQASHQFSQAGWRQPGRPNVAKSDPKQQQAEESAVEAPPKLSYEDWLVDNPKPEQEWFTWKSRDGGHSVAGKLISVNNDDVTIEKEDGDEVVVSRKQLSDETNELLDEYAIPQLATYARKLDAWQRAADARRNLSESSSDSR